MIAKLKHRFQKHLRSYLFKDIGGGRSIKAEACSHFVPLTQRSSIRSCEATETTPQLFFVSHPQSTLCLPFSLRASCSVVHCSLYLNVFSFQTQLWAVAAESCVRKPIQKLLKVFCRCPNLWQVWTISRQLYVVQMCLQGRRDFSMGRINLSVKARLRSDSKNTFGIALSAAHNLNAPAEMHNGWQLRLCLSWTASNLCRRDRGFPAKDWPTLDGTEALMVHDKCCCDFSGVQLHWLHLSIYCN